jgi:hypothetical protein
VRSVAAKSNTPASKSVVISIRPAMEELDKDEFSTRKEETS